LNVGSCCHSTGSRPADAVVENYRGGVMDRLAPGGPARTGVVRSNSDSPIRRANLYSHDVTGLGWVVDSDVSDNVEGTSPVHFEQKLDSATTVLMRVHVADANDRRASVP
jgi:hypothetical protein